MPGKHRLLRGCRAARGRDGSTVPEAVVHGSTALRRPRRSGLVAAAVAIGTLSLVPSAMADRVVATGTQNATPGGPCIGPAGTEQVRVAQSFVPSSSGLAKSATVVTTKAVGDPTGAGTATVQLKRATGGIPQGSALATGSFAVSGATGVRTSGVTFNTPAEIRAGEQYALEISFAGQYCAISSSRGTVTHNVPGQKGTQFFFGSQYDVEGFGYTVTVAGQDPPSCAGDRLSTAFNTPADVVPTCTGTRLTYSVKTAPARGSLGPVGADGRVRYTPAADVHGSDSFALTATDSEGQTATETVTVGVAKPAAPTCAGDAAQIDFNTPGDVTFSCAGDRVSYAVGDAPQHGTLGAVSGNRVRYAPNGGFTGEDAFTVVATDVVGQRTVNTVRVTVGGARQLVDNPDDQLTHQVAQGQFSLPAGERVTKALSCPAGQLATDGHALVRAVDQDKGTPADVRVSRASRTSADTYTFSIQNPTDGQAQGQLSVDCISPATFLGGRLTLSDPLTRTVAVDGSAVATLRCPDGTKAIAPGFSGEDPALSDAPALTSSRPTADGTGWRFAFSGLTPRGVDVSVSCLGYATDTGALLTSVTSTETANVGGRSTSSTQVGCPVGTVGIVGGHSAPAGLAPLGQELQARARIFWFQNTGTDGASATLSVLCVGLSTRTTSSPVAPAGLPSPALLAPPVALASPTDPADSAPATRIAARVRASALRSGLPVTVTVPGAGASVRIVALDAGKQVGSLARTVAGGTRKLALPISKAARKRLGKAGHRTLKVKVTVGGRTTTKTVRVTR